MKQPEQKGWFLNSKRRVQTKNDMEEDTVWDGVQVEQLVLRLHQYNKWRRGDDSIEQPHPKQIGEDIDLSIELLEKMSDAIISTLNNNLHLADGDNCTLIELKKLAEQKKTKMKNE